MSENITVAVRIRPLTETEVNNQDYSIWSISPNSSDTLIIAPSNTDKFSEQGKVANLLGTKFKFSIFLKKAIQ